MVLVRDMWLMGFDAPQPAPDVRGQADVWPRADAGHRRVNRVFRDRRGGLVVDYLGLTHELERALAIYSESGGTALDKEQAEALSVDWTA